MNDEPNQNAHRRAWDLIPWVVNGTAPETDLSWFSMHLAGCPDCRDELAFHQELREGILSDEPAPSDVEPALARLMSRIDRDEGEPAVTRPFYAATSRRSRWIGGLAAAVVVQAVALGTMAGLVFGRDPPVAEYQTLSQDTYPRPPVVIRLVPAPTMLLADLRALLDRNGLRISETSGDGTIFGLAPARGQTLDVAEVLASLRATPSILLAEPIQAPAPRGAPRAAH